MTYGEVATQMRDSLAELLTHPTPYYEIRGRPITDDATHRRFRERADLIQRYRGLVLQHVVENARTYTVGVRRAATIVPRWLYNVEVSVPPRDHLPDGRFPNAIELGTKQGNEIVDLWRKAAVAAFIAREREAALVGEQVDAAQGLVVLKDIADVMYALIRLDDRHRRLPGWRGLAGEGARTNRPHPKASSYARGLSATTHYFGDWVATQLTPEGFSVDHIGYRLQPEFEPTGGTITGAIAALENLSAILQADFPRALSLRMLFRSQWKLSMLAARLAHAGGDTSAAAALTVRGKVYADLIHAMRNVTGTLGDGIYAVSYGGVATDQIARTPSITREETVWLIAALDDLDARVARVTRQGAATGVLLMATGEVTLARRGPGGVRRPQATHRAITPQTNPLFYRLLSTLEPHRRPRAPTPAAITQRAEFAATLRRAPQDSPVSNDDRAAKGAASRRTARMSSVLTC